MGCIDQVKDALSQAVFTPSTLLSGRGGLHICQIILCLVTFFLSLFRGVSYNGFWIYAMFTWALCSIMTLIITILEMFKLDVVLNMFCLNWADFTTGMAMTSSLMTISVAIYFANFYARLTDLFGLIVSVLAILCGILYALEVVKDKFLDRKQGIYFAALPGFWKVLEAFVSCMIFVCVSGYRDQIALILCVVAYVIPFPILPLIIVTNILKKLKNCLPFSLDKFVFIFLVISVILYVFAAIMYPIFMFKGNPRPDDCPPTSCIWALQFMVAFFTYINLILFVLDLIFTLLGICGFKRT